MEDGRGWYGWNVFVLEPPHGPQHDSFAALRSEFPLPGLQVARASMLLLLMP